VRIQGLAPLINTVK